jgi:hypothetical protein
MGIIVENRLITLNTRYGTRMNGTYLSSLEFPFKGILKEEDGIVSANVSVMNAQLPVSWYIVNQSNNQFRYDGTWLSIPSGNYNGNSFIAVLLSLMNGLIPGSVTSIDLISSTGVLKFTFATSRTLIFPSALQGSGPGTNFVNLIFGAEADVSYTGTVTSLPYPLNLLGINRLAIRSSRLLISSFNSFDMGKGINLATIPVDQPPWGLVNYSNETDLNKAVLEVKYVDLIDIQIADENNQLIDFNNTNWTLTLVLEIIRNIPDRFVPSFRELTVEAKPPEKEKQIAQDMKELEALA